MPHALPSGVEKIAVCVQGLVYHTFASLAPMHEVSPIHRTLPLTLQDLLMLLLTSYSVVIAIVCCMFEFFIARLASLGVHSITLDALGFVGFASNFVSRHIAGCLMRHIHHKNNSRLM